MRRLLLLVPALLAGVLGVVVSALPASAAAPAPAPAERWALLVGLDHFQGATRPNLGAVNDVATFRQALLKAGWADDHIKVLTDGAANAADIRSGMQWLSTTAAPPRCRAFPTPGPANKAGRPSTCGPTTTASSPTRSSQARCAS